MTDRFGPRSAWRPEWLEEQFEDTGLRFLISLLCEEFGVKDIKELTPENWVEYEGYLKEIDVFGDDGWGKSHLAQSMKKILLAGREGKPILNVDENYE